MVFLHLIPINDIPRMQYLDTKVEAMGSGGEDFYLSKVASVLGKLHSLGINCN